MSWLCSSIVRKKWVAQEPLSFVCDCFWSITLLCKISVVSAFYILVKWLSCSLSNSRGKRRKWDKPCQVKPVNKLIQSCIYHGLPILVLKRWKKYFFSQNHFFVGKKKAAVFLKTLLSLEGADQTFRPKSEFKMWELFAFRWTNDQTIILLIFFYSEKQTKSIKQDMSNRLQTHAFSSILPQAFLFLVVCFLLTGNYWKLAINYNRNVKLFLCLPRDDSSKKAAVNF